MNSRGSSKLCLDLVKFEPKYERAFLYALGNTLVCEAQDEGRRLAFEGAQRHKVVTLDGTLFSKNGQVTGGVSESLGRGGSKWDSRAYEQLKQQRAG